MAVIVLNKAHLKEMKPTWVYVGRPSILGNRYAVKPSNVSGTVQVESLHESLTKYKDWLDSEWRKRGEVFWKLIRLPRAYKKYQKLTLVCWCKPEQCHGDILADAIIKLSENKKYCPSEEE